MPSTFSNADAPFNTALPTDQIPRLLNSILRRLNWQDIFIDEAQCTITANQKSDEQIMGKKWDNKFQLTARWQSINNLASNVVLAVSESNQPGTAHICTRKFTEIAEALIAEHERLLPAGQPVANIPSPNAPKIKGARFATINELSQAGYLAEHTSPKELLITHLPDSDKFMRVPENDTNRHAIVCGPTGSGKTTGIFIPNLLERTQASAIVTEATGGNGIADLYTKTAGYRSYCGHQILYFNPDDLHSQQINPLDSVNTYRQARRACEIIFNSTTLRTHRGDQSWEMAERQLLTALILHAVSQRSQGNCHFGYVNQMLDDGPRGLNHTMQTSPLSEARRSYTRFIQTCTEGYRNLVINGLMTRLDGWNSPRVRKLTERTTVDFDTLTDRLFTLYLAVPADSTELKPLMALILNYVLDSVQRRTFQHPLMLMLDEFTNFGAVRNLPAKLTILRHDGIPAVLGVQDYVQLENMYDKEAKLLISQPATRIFFKPNDIDTAQKVSQMLGDTHKEWQRLTSNGQLQDKDRKDPLLSPSDLLTMGVFESPPNPTAPNLTAPDATSPASPNTTATSPNPDPTASSKLESKSMIVFLPNTHPVRVPALTWQNYALQTEPTTFPIPQIPAVEVDESLSFTPPSPSTSDAHTTEPHPSTDHIPNTDPNLPNPTFADPQPGEKKLDDY